jgi:hypothetical protein
LKTVDVWEVSELRVNGTTLLEDWLPFNTLSDRNVTLDSAAVYQWDQNPKRLTQKVGAYRKEKVQSVTAEVLHRWKVPVRMPAPKAP